MNDYQRIIEAIRCGKCRGVGTGYLELVDGDYMHFDDDKPCGTCRGTGLNDQFGPDSWNYVNIKDHSVVLDGTWVQSTQ